MTHSIDVPIHRHPPISCVPSVGSRLNRLRRQAGISPDEMAKLLRMDKSQYAWCEQNTAVLEEGRLARLATLYGVDLEYLQGTTNQPRKPPKQLTEVNDIIFHARTRAMDECYPLVERMRKTIKGDIKSIIARVNDEDADLLGQVGVVLEKELDDIFTRLVQGIGKDIQQYIGGKHDETHK